MSSGPLPTSLVFLSALPSLPTGHKVRFLGCVTKYRVATGILELQHVYPPLPNISPIALVDVNLLLESLKREDTLVGEWVNVIGYVEGNEANTPLKKTSTMVANSAPHVRVQAIMLWPARTVKLGEYERVLEQRTRIAS